GITACRTTSSSWPWQYSHIAWWPAHGTLRCSGSRKPRKLRCGRSWSRCGFRYSGRSTGRSRPLGASDTFQHRLKSVPLSFMNQQSSLLVQIWAKADRAAVRAFLLSIAALAGALLLAVYSGAAAELGNLGLAASSALLALAIAGWVGVTLVPT